MTPMLPSTPDHPALALLPDAPTRAQIEAFGQRIEAMESAGLVDLHTKHHINADIYGRSIVLGAETFLVGLAHTHPGIAVCVGDITVWTEDGRQRYTGAHIIQTKPGRMRVGFAHAETTWLTVHANKTGGTDVEKIEDSLVERPERLMTRHNLLKVTA